MLRRSKTAERGYGGKWQRARLAFLAEPGNQFCVKCQGRGLLNPGTMHLDGSIETSSRRIGLVVDHIVPHRGNQRLFWDRSNWQPLCHDDHDIVKQREEHGREAQGTRSTLSALQAVTPPNENYMGVVLTGAGAGYYSRSGSAWVFGRGFPDTFARLVSAVGTNDISAGVAAGVSPSAVLVYLLSPPATNTGPMRLNVSGMGLRPLNGFDGAALEAGFVQINKPVMVYDNGDGTYRLLVDHRFQVLADQVAEDRDETRQLRDQAAVDADRSENAANVAGGFASALIIAENTFSTRTTAEAWSPVEAPDYIRTAGYSAPGDGGGALYVLGGDGAGPGQFQIEKSDGEPAFYMPGLARRRYVDVADYCDQNDAVDATAGIAAALAVGEGREVVFSSPIGGSRAYKVSSTLTVPQGSRLINAGNATIDFSGGPTAVFDGTLFKAEGSMGAAVSVTAPVLEGDHTVPVTSSAGFSRGDKVYLSSSSERWDITDDNCFMGEIHEVRSVAAGEVTFYEPVMYPMAADLTLAKVNYLDPIRFEGIKAFGKEDVTSRQFGADLRMVEGFVAEDCDFTYFEDRCFWIWRGYNPQFRGGLIGHCHSPGRSYPIQFAGATYFAKVNGTHFVDARHAVDFGDIYGVNRFGIVSDVTVSGMREAALSTHTAADHILFDGFTVTCDKADPVAAGVLLRGINSTVKNGRILGANTNAVYALLGPKFAGVEKFESLIVEGATGNFSMIRVQDTSAGGSKSITVTDCDLTAAGGAAGSIGIEIRSSLGSLEKVRVSDNTIANSNVGIAIRADASANINSVTMHHNDMTIVDSGTSSGMNIQNLGTGVVKNIMADHNKVFGNPDHGYREINTGGGTISDTILIGNNLKAATTKKTIVATNFVDQNNMVS